MGKLLGIFSVGSLVEGSLTYIRLESLCKYFISCSIEVEFVPAVRISEDTIAPDKRSCDINVFVSLCPGLHEFVDFCSLCNLLRIHQTIGDNAHEIELGLGLDGGGAGKQFLDVFCRHFRRYG